MIGTSLGPYKIIEQLGAGGMGEVRGGPQISDSLLRWNPDRGEGVWNATEETEFPG